jgi:hypothetical protein
MTEHDHNYLSTKGAGEPARDPLAGLKIAFGDVRDVAEVGAERDVTVQVSDTMLDRWVECKAAGLWPDPRPGREGQYVLCFADEVPLDPPTIVFDAPERSDDAATTKFDEATGDYKAPEDHGT